MEFDNWYMAWDIFTSIVQGYRTAIYNKLKEPMPKERFRYLTYKLGGINYIFDELSEAFGNKISSGDAEDLIYLLTMYEERFKMYKERFSNGLEKIFEGQYDAVHSIRHYYEEHIENYYGGV